MNGGQKPKLWIDLDNTPHVPFFQPIIEELRGRGYDVLVTARDAFQVCQLAEKLGIANLKVGRHSGKSRVRKIAGLVVRALKLLPVVLREKPVLAISHGSRAQVLAANMAGLPCLWLDDYECSKALPFLRLQCVLVPDVIPDSALSWRAKRILKYPGIKEDVYAWRLQPDAALLGALGITNGDVVVTVRPPATEAHYHNPDSEKLFTAFMERATALPHTRIVLLPRNKNQESWIRNEWPHWFQQQKTIVPNGAVDGMNLVWHSDLVVSGGGTMNREAAALGVPVYSIFRGPIGEVDRHLSRCGKLIMIQNVTDVQQRIKVEKRSRTTVTQATSRRALLRIVEVIEKLSAGQNQ